MGLLAAALLLLSPGFGEASCPAPVETSPSPGRFAIVEGVAADGGPTELWIAILERRGVDLAAAEAGARRPFTAAERGWVDAIRTALPELERDLPRLARPFEPVRLPHSIAIVVGNRGASDAFTHDASTIGFDLAVLLREYGAADDPENGARIARFLRHETIHLLQKARPELVPGPLLRPLDRAITECWSEGHGNLESLSEKWRAKDGTLTGTSTQALARLEPRLVARLAALACATPEEERELTRDLSNGPFAEKWGALPVALWLARASAASPAALRDYVQSGPVAVWDLARRNLSPELGRVLDEARVAAEECPSRLPFSAPEGAELRSGPRQPIE